MASLVPLVAAAVTSAGFGTAVGLLVVGRRRPVPATEAGGIGPDGGVTRPRTSALDLARRVVPAAYAHFLDRQILLAGRPAAWTIGRVLFAKPALTIVSAVLALSFLRLIQPSPLTIGMSLFVVVLAFFIPDLLIYSRAIERQQRMELELPDTLDQMTISVEAGLGFEAAMAKAATNGNGPLAEELIRALQDMSIGRTRRAAYESLAERTTCKDLRRFVRAVIQADLYGVPIVDVLRVQASEMRLKRRQRAEEKAMKVPVLVLFPLLFCILPVLFIVLLAPAALNAARTFGILP